MVGYPVLSRRKKPSSMRLPAILVTALTIVALLPRAPRPALALGPAPVMLCPGPIEEGESGQFGMRWPGSYLLTPVFVLTNNEGHTAGRGDFAAIYRQIVGDGVTETHWVPVSTIEDSLTEHDETFEVGLFTVTGFVSCVITIEDDDAPAITDVAVTSNPLRGDVYRSGENIDVTLTFDRRVDVVGDASLTLLFGDGDQNTPRQAGYLEGSGTRFLVFRYQVQPSDRDSDGIAVSSAEESEESGPIHGFSGTVYARGTDIPIDYTHAGIERASDHKVDGRPRVEHVGVISTPPDGWEAYRAGQTIEIALDFDTDVVVEGEVGLALYVGLVSDNWAEAWREAGYLRGSGTDTLVFGYTVEPGDLDIRGIAIPHGATAVRGSGTIKASGTDVEYLEHFPATGHLPDHKIDTAPPTISGIYLTSRPTDGEAYAVGEVIRVEVVFREPVAKSGDLQFELDIGGTTRLASLRPEANPNRRYDNEIEFEYQVQSGDTDSDGIEFRANSLKLNGGTIHDRAGNAADLSHEPVAANPLHMVGTNP